jgi:hypothetical protein
MRQGYSKKAKSGNQSSLSIKEHYAINTISGNVRLTAAKSQQPILIL